MSLFKYAKCGLVGAFLAVTSASHAEVTLGARDASGLPGEQVVVPIFFIGNGEARTYQFDLSVDLDSIQGGAAGIDVSRCLEDAPDQPIQNCVVRDEPNNNTVRVGQASFTDPIPDIDPIGVVLYTISSDAQAGDEIAITITDFDVEGVGAEAVTVSNAVIGVVEGPPAEPRIDPLSWEAAAVIDGSSPSETFTVTNAAEPDQSPPAADLAIESVDIVGDNAFTVAGGSCEEGTSLSPEASCTVVVSLGTEALGDFSATLQVGHDAGDALNAMLTGTVRDSDAELVIGPASVEYGELDIDADPICADFTVSNTPGDDALTIGSATVEGAPFSISANSCDGSTLAGNESCSVTVCFDPAEEETFTDALEVTSDANNVTATLTGTGTAEAEISVEPDFGPVDLGVDGPGETLNVNGTVTNSGSAAAEVSCELDDDTGVFSTDPSPLAATVEASSSVDFTLSCALPDDGEEGDTYSATLTCSVDGVEVGVHELECGVTEFEPLPVPTMSNWSIALFAMLMLLVGGISIRFFRV